MSKLVTVPQMIAIEKAANSAGLTYSQMMQNAGQSLANYLHAHSHTGERRVLALVGSGNNGGDSLVALAILAQLGWESRAYLSVERKEDPLIAHLIESGGNCSLHDESDPEVFPTLLSQCDVFLDSLLGTGINLPLRKPEATILSAAKEALDDLADKPLIVAVDCPSGMDCQTGQLAPETIPADITFCVAAVKIGMLTFPAFNYLGSLETGDIGLSEELKEWGSIDHFVVDEAMFRAALPDRPMNSHKGTFGKVLILAGSEEYPGAALLAAKSAARSGVGLVTIAASSHLKSQLAGHLPEATWLPILAPPDATDSNTLAQLQKALPAYNAFLIGPGLADKKKNAAFFEKILELPNLPPLLIDATALRFLAAQSNAAKRQKSPSILTPHPGEFAALSKLSIQEIQEDRISHAQQYAKKWAQVLVLKGALTVIADPNGRVAVIPIAHPALATAGSGDVLAGLTAGLLAQGMPPFEAAYVAAHAHAQAGLIAAEFYSADRGILASDFIDFLPELLAK